MAPPPHFLYFILADLRERETVTLNFVNSFLTSVSLSIVALEAVLLQKVNLPVSSVSSSFSFLLMPE